MAIGGYFIHGYYDYLIVVIGGYSINGYCDYSIYGYYDYFIMVISGYYMLYYNYWRLLYFIYIYIYISQAIGSYYIVSYLI